MQRTPRRWVLALAGGLALSLTPLSAVAGSSSIEAGDLARSTSQLPRTATVAPAINPVAQPPAGGYRVNYPALIRYELGVRGADPRLGGHYTAQVTDSSGRAIWSHWPAVAYLPASNNKLVTAYVALRSMGPTTRISTTVNQDPARSWLLYLKGGGDPSLSSSRLASLASATATALQVQGRSAVYLRFDDTLFPAPTNAPGWKSSYVPYDISPVRALVVDSHNRTDTSKDAAATFRSMLQARGIDVRSMYRATTPSTAGVIATTRSPTVASLVTSMLNVSQNDYAEALFRLSAKARGYKTTWTGGRYNALSVMRASGAPVTGWVSYDGSGLSRWDKVPARTLTGLLRVIDTDPTLRDVVFGPSALPIAGRTGTLASRFTTAPTSCARGIVQAKTGSLNDVTALSGVAIGLDGQRRYFSVLVNGTPNTSSTRTAIDRVAASATGCF